MVRPSSERVLLVGDSDRAMHAALMQAMPAAQVISVPSYFDAIAELVAAPYTAVLAAAEPIERRPESAVKTLRALAGQGRLLLFGESTLEPLSRKMLEFGADDYLITPANPGELQQVFGAPPLRLTDENAAGAIENEPTVSPSTTRISALMGVPIADLILEALLQHPQDAPAAAVAQINSHLGPAIKLELLPPGESIASVEESFQMQHAIRSDNKQTATLHLTMPQDEDENAGRHFLAQVAHLLGKVTTLQERHASLQKLAITDEMTGLYNGRYFKHFLSRIVEKARQMRFPVTLLLFDIDDFKKYNDKFGHGMGDEILKQTATLIRRCCRDHDLVARIGGDEFAVIFWEKEGPRQPRDPKSVSPGRVPQTALQVFERFRRLLAAHDFTGLGPSGKGVLTASGGLAVFPYDAQTPEALIEAADKELMFRAKMSGKNSIFLVGGSEAGGGGSNSSGTGEPPASSQ